MQHDNKLPIIKVIGLGGAGRTAVRTMLKEKIQNVELIIADTNMKGFDSERVENKIQLGKKTTEGLGAGGKPEIGKLSAIEAEDKIRKQLLGSNMVFITLGLGGGTGSGSAPVVSKICKEEGILSVIVATTPFKFEGRPRNEKAEKSLQLIEEYSDSFIIISNEKLRSSTAKHTKLLDAFKTTDEILTRSVRAITDIMTVTGHINLDFQDIKTVLYNSRKCFIGISEATSKSVYINAVEEALFCPLLENASIEGAKDVIINITCSDKIPFEDITFISDKIHEKAGSDTNIFWGAVFDNSLKEEVTITVIATGI